MDRVVSGGVPLDWQGLLNLVDDQEFRLSMLSAEERQKLFPALYGSVVKPMVHLAQLQGQLVGKTAGSNGAVGTSGKPAPKKVCNICLS